MPEREELTLHATAVAVGDAGVLLIGASGSGKSSLALELMTRGAALVADDRVILRPEAGGVRMSCPQVLRGMIEARGIGILHAVPASDARLGIVVDMDRTETERMPPERTIRYFDQDYRLLHKVASGHFPAAVIQYLKFTRTPNPPVTTG